MNGSASERESEFVLGIVFENENAAAAGETLFGARAEAEADVQFHETDVEIDAVLPIHNE